VGVGESAGTQAEVKKRPLMVCPLCPELLREMLLVSNQQMRILLPLLVAMMVWAWAWQLLPLQLP